MRRLWCAALLLTACGAAAQDYPAVEPGRALSFPADRGSHPAYRTEWWYVTAWLKDEVDEGGREFGVQVTFFRNRPRIAEDNPSAFAPKQLLFAHAALADPAHGRLRHDQRSARAGFGLAQAAQGETEVRIGDWSLARTPDGYAARIAAREFRLALNFRPTQPELPQGEAGYSRKGPLARQASRYYSVPQLEVAGTVQVEGSVRQVSGRAWLDHEWSSEILAPEAVGWDWAGINLADGGALMAFRLRDARGGTVWSGGSQRGADGRLHVLRPGEVRFEPLRRWRSPRTGAEYPVAMRVSAAGQVLELIPLMDDQELDARASTGTVYWEGAVRARRNDADMGRGYLELTGYWKPLKM